MTYTFEMPSATAKDDRTDQITDQILHVVTNLVSNSAEISDLLNEIPADSVVVNVSLMVGHIKN
jgi:hypothetical protein